MTFGAPDRPGDGIGKRQVVAHGSFAERRQCPRVRGTFGADSSSPLSRRLPDHFHGHAHVVAKCASPKATQSGVVGGPGLPSAEDSRPHQRSISRTETAVGRLPETGQLPRTRSRPHASPAKAPDKAQAGHKGRPVRCCACGGASIWRSSSRPVWASSRPEWRTAIKPAGGGGPRHSRRRSVRPAP
jgi:hypothetical protein